MELMVEKVSNGFIITNGYQRRVFKTLEEVFNYILLSIEGRCSSFKDSSYGKVVIINDPSTEDIL